MTEVGGWILLVDCIADHLRLFASTPIILGTVDSLRLLLQKSRLELAFAPQIRLILGGGRALPDVGASTYRQRRPSLVLKHHLQALGSC